MQLVLSILLDITLGIAILFTTYTLVVAMFGFRKEQIPYPMIPDRSRFCIFVPSHNEEGIIQATVENMHQLDYDPALFDIFFLADNCKDETAKRMKESIQRLGRSNFHVLERQVDDPNVRGKPHALQWGIQQLEHQDGFYKKYDHFMVLDADNFVDPTLLKHFNSQYHSYPREEQPCMIQCYLDSKNANNVIARGYQVSYRISNRFFQLAKRRLGLNVAIGGTGFAITTEFLHELGGFKARSLTEDLEMQTIATTQGRRIAMNFAVRIYDEKPTGLKQSIVQKTRWAQGHWWNAFHHGPRLLKSLFHRQSMRQWWSKFDNVVYLFTMLNYGLAAFNLLLSLVAMAFGLVAEPHLPYVTYVFLINLVVHYIVIYPYAVYQDGAPKEKKRFLPDFILNIISIFLSGVVFTISSVLGLFKHRNQKVWVKTVHSVTSMDHGPLQGDGTLPSTKKAESKA